MKDINIFDRLFAHSGFDSKILHFDRSYFPFDIQNGTYSTKEKPKGHGI